MTKGERGCWRECAVILSEGLISRHKEAQGTTTRVSHWTHKQAWWWCGWCFWVNGYSWEEEVPEESEASRSIRRNDIQVKSFPHWAIFTLDGEREEDATELNGNTFNQRPKLKIEWIRFLFASYFLRLPFCWVLTPLQSSPLSWQLENGEEIVTFPAVPFLYDGKATFLWHHLLRC